MPENTKKTLFKTMTENLHEVSLDQIKPGMDVLSGHGRLFIYTPNVNTTILDAWAMRGNDGRQYFMADPPAPEYEPGTLALVTPTREGWDERSVVRTHRGTDWVDQRLLFWRDDEVSNVEVIAYPDGTRPVPQITEEDVESARRAFWGPLGNPNHGGMRRALEDFAARKFGGQA